MSARTAPAVRHGVPLSTDGATKTTVATLETNPGKAYHVRARIIGIAADGSAANVYTLEAAFINIADTLAIIGSQVQVMAVEGDASWGSPTLESGSASDEGNIIATVTGLSATDIDWRADLDVLELAATGV